MKFFNIFCAILIGILGISFSTGCRSIQAVKVNRGIDGKYSGNNLSTRGRGVPLKLKVPSHVEVKVEETILVNKETGKLLNTGKRMLNVSPKMEYTEQMFFVDIARPIAGNVTANSEGDGWNLDSEGYLSSFGASIKDETLADINSIVTSEKFGKVFKASVNVSGGNVLKEFEQINRTVAVRRFDITQPCWQDDMNAWIENFLQHCSDKCMGTGCPPFGGPIQTVDRESYIVPVSPATPSS